jgi:drug/metabolite transporter (DMT)-like permease
MMRATWRDLSGNVRGAIFLLVSGVFFTVDALFLRAMSADTPTVWVTCGRALAQTALVLVLWVAAGNRLTALIPSRPGLMLWRGALSVTAWWLAYEAVRRLELTVATVLGFTTSLFVALLAGPVLRERVDAARWIATIVGFLGVLLVVRPGTVEFDIGMAMMIGASFLSACIALTNRTITRFDRVEVIMIWIGVIAFVGSLPPALATGRWPNPHDILMIAGVGVLGAIGMSLTLNAYRVGEASAIAPVPYSRLIFAAIVGWIAWGEWPDAWTWAGAAVISAAALWLARVEARRRVQ